ncbi:hypothetical protein M413DRAFT_439891 [Hebeloma cylindrosporum]|uniref:U3 small nucleolar ribonucleoprotein protein MPP10 n=1 Tax=Hebeloma cylindrosporum TaxID=76867 RepID=A0A0C3CHI1_HEBCY|nr:hypothetical protein M413DRAFT_439891 [Hebeloma cylindrosporum h7]
MPDIILPDELLKLSNLLDDSLETLSSGNDEICKAALSATKHIFDLSIQSEATSRSHITELISGLAPSAAPQTRSKAKSAGQQLVPNGDQMQMFDFTPLKSLFVDGMDEEQIWAQLDLRTKTICRMLDFVLEGESESQDEVSEEGSDDSDDALRKALEALEGDDDVDMDEFLEKYGLAESDDSDASMEDGDEDGDMGSQSELSEDGIDGEEGISPLRDSSSDEESGSERLAKPALKPTHKRKRNTATSELDDDFFNLAEFNADTERAESKSASRGRLAGDDDSEDDENAIDFFASVDPAANFDEDDLENEGELFYRDFFEPPSRSSSTTSPKKTKAVNSSQVRFHEEVRVKKIKPTGKNRPLRDDSIEEGDDDDDEEEDEDEDEHGPTFDDQDSEDDDDDDSELHEDEDDEDVESNIATIQRLKNDLFAEEEEEANDMTTHERRMAALREQITELEAENVAPKEWVLMGEAGTRQRPQNSLLEEDLEFDRVMKAVPVTTEESVKSLEEVIKSRILEGRFDDVVRIRPLEDKPFLPSKFLELQDTKSKDSLAQIYENEYLGTQSGDGPTDDRDGKLQKEHEEINLLWDKICGKLDALSNAHFVPGQPKATISTITNTATAALESALPTTKSTSTMLAPEEVFSAPPSSLQARSELTPSEKRALRTKERKLKKRQRDTLEKSVDKFAKSRGISGAKKEKQAALESIVKHGKGVTVVGKPVMTSKDKRKKSS